MKNELKKKIEMNLHCVNYSYNNDSNEKQFDGFSLVVRTFLPINSNIDF